MSPAPEAGAAHADVRKPAQAPRSTANWFFWGLFVCVALAWLWPEGGRSGGTLQAERWTRIGVALVFFLHGFGLRFEQLKAGALLWRQHLVVQSLGFVVLPLIGFGWFWVSEPFCDVWLRIGMLYLCALPSTIATAVVLTGAAAGNVPVAIFNATLSGVLGVVVTPVWLRLALSAGVSSPPLLDMVGSLATLLVLPLVVGQGARLALRSRLLEAMAKKLPSRFRAAVVRPLSRVARVLDRAVILFIVYAAFAESFHARVWSAFSLADFVVAVVMVGATLGVVIRLSTLIAQGLEFARDQRVAITFSASTKSLAIGVPMAAVIFPAAPNLGPLLLPLMLYHPLQLVVCGALANRWGLSSEAERI